VLSSLAIIAFINLNFKNMKFVFFIFTFSLFYGFQNCSAQGKESAEITHIQVQRFNDSFVDVYYNRPANPRKKYPLILFCQGSGYDSNSEGILSLLRMFDKKAVGLVIEKEGVKYGDKGDKLSKEYKAANAVYHRCYDYLRVLQYLKNHASWWNGDVYVIGGSEGGLLAGMIASFYPNVKAVGILSFGGGMNFNEAWMLATKLQKKKEGWNEEKITQEIQSAKDSLAQIRKNPTSLKSYSGEDNTFAWWNSILDIRLENSLLDLNIPILVAHGTEDLMAPFASATKLKNDFEAKGKKNLHLKAYKGYDHGFSDGEQKSHLVEVFVDAIAWLLKQ